MSRQGEHATRGEHKALEYLSFTSGYLYRLVRWEARDLGIRWTALMVLKDLAVMGPSTQRALAATEQMREPTMSVLLGQMQRSGWITRQRDPRNARVRLAVITPKGGSVLRDAGCTLRQRLAAELDELSTGELDGVREGLEPLVALLVRRIGDVKAQLQ